MFYSFSKPRIVSIVLLLAILVISLMFSSYSEGMASDAIMSESDAAAIINQDAPKAKTGEDAGPLTNTPIAGITDSSVKPSDGIVIGSGKLLTVADITGVLQNNPGVQKMINSKP
jgi:hypothetical protein